MQGPKAWTYGEISYPGVVTLKDLLSPCSGTFYDLGSGFGRMVLQVKSLLICEVEVLPLLPTP